MRSALQDQRCWSDIAGLSPGAGHSFATRGGMERVGRSRAGSIKRAASPFGGHDIQRARAPGCVRGWSPRLGQAADLSVTKAVVDEGEKFAGGSDLADAFAPAVGHPVVVGLEERAAPLALRPRPQPSAPGGCPAW